MNKNVVEMYERALKVVLDEYGLTEDELFHTNRLDAVHARTALILPLSKRMCDSDIALCTHMKRNSVCGVRNKHRGANAWDVCRCIDDVNAVL